MRRKKFLLVLGGVGALTLLSLLGGPNLALRALGLTRQGKLATALAAAALPVEATVGEPLDAVAIACPACEKKVWIASRQDLSALEITGGLDADGRPVYRIVFDEAGFNRYFQTVLVPWGLGSFSGECRNLWVDLREGGAVIYADVDLMPWFSLPSGAPYMGVSFEYTEGGIKVREVVPFSPASRAGLEVGDVIRELDGVPATDVSDLAAWIRMHAPGEVIRLGVLRGEGDVRERIDIEVTLETWTEEAKWRAVGLVLVPDVTGARLVPLGLSIGDDLYSLPEAGRVSDAVGEVQALLNGFMEELTIVGPLEGEARLAQVAFEEDRLIAVIR